MRLVIIAGVAENNVIGSRNELPWHILEDLKRFKDLTTGNPVIMGRKTYESIVKKLGRPLPNRKNIVITRQADYGVSEGVIVANSVGDALKKAEKHGDNCFVIGGQNIYEQTINLADAMEITHVHKNYEGDAYFPEIKKDEWKEVSRQDKKIADVDFSFVRYEKQNNGKNENGVFIAFEGIDGCGKSTQIRKLAQHIFEKDKHNHIVLTREPYKDGNIRKILHEDSDPYSKAEKLAELYINDRKKHSEELIKPNFEKGHFVLSDRFKLSTVAYQTAQGLLMEELIKRHEGLPVPDITFIIDVMPEVASERMRKESVNVRGKEHKFEANLDFARKLRENYLRAAELMKSKGERIYVVNGERSENEIFSDIRKIFESVIGKNNA